MAPCRIRLRWVLWTVVLGLCIALLPILVVLVARTYTTRVSAAAGLALRGQSAHQWVIKTAQPTALSPQERQELKEALKGAIRLQTVSFSDKEQNTTALAEFEPYIRRVFPELFSAPFIQHEVIGEYSHLFTIQGSNPQLQPYMLIAHIDVVPATSDGWDIDDPFSAEERDGFIYGRGTLDNKNSVVAILHALEFLLRRNYRPRRSFYIGFGHDEEVGGKKGAMKIVTELESRGVELSFLLDEGSFIFDGVFTAVKKPIAIVGITEKGSITASFSVTLAPGHSSAPSKRTSIGILSEAISKLELNPMPNLFGHGPELMMFEQMAPEFSFPLNIIMANLWLFAPLVGRILEQVPSTNTLVRTTTAITMFHAGVKSNVIPQSANATINFRIHPSQTVEQVLKIAEKTIDDNRVKIETMNAFDPLPVSPWDDQTLGVQVFRQTILDVFPDVGGIVPGICVANTDSRHYGGLTKAIYRFNSVIFKPDDLPRFHGLNERISIESYEKQVEFFFQLIQNSDIDEQADPHRDSHEL
ncbi:N-fatty-acyl-amino acid synthase/hydrolase PM20D1 isoform X3 [Hemicordylus capensis]|uniref:N-fatty-acyl-amino acid synthase/hydrolase PM20D1 isoform X3 n=1 Tax=Hemicordylus capensis TaxID=884348 RepID=UPI002302B7EB|nr:N-fatty-acyl-amino acid synthase/hydrolase PM20D1 isoform X3 [Hemicordylus capensis]